MPNPKAAPSTIARPILALLGFAMALAVGACEQSLPSDSAPWLALSDEAASDPPGAALPLSIGDVVNTDHDERSVAINCAVALGLTADRITDMTDGPYDGEIAVMRRAKDFFEARAGEANPEVGSSNRTVQSELDRRQSEKSDDAAGQAQLAIACLRRFGRGQDGAI